MRAQQSKLCTLINYFMCLNRRVSSYIAREYRFKSATVGDLHRSRQSSFT